MIFFNVKNLILKCVRAPLIIPEFSSQMVVRNYRVYYHVRLELLTPLLNGVQRALVMPNSVLEK